MDKLLIIKIGGNIVDDEEPSYASFLLADFSLIREKKILVHGGGKLATRLALQPGDFEQQMVEGRRITDAETLKDGNDGLCRLYQ